MGAVAEGEVSTAAEEPPSLFNFFELVWALAEPLNVDGVGTSPLAGEGDFAALDDALLAVIPNKPGGFRASPVVRADASAENLPLRMYVLTQRVAVPVSG